MAGTSSPNSSRTGSPTIPSSNTSSRTNTLTSSSRPASHSLHQHPSRTSTTPPSSLRKPPPILCNKTPNARPAVNRQVSFASSVPPTPRKYRNRSTVSTNSLGSDNGHSGWYCEKCSSLNSNSSDGYYEDVKPVEEKKPGIVGTIAGALIYVLCNGCVIGGDNHGRATKTTSARKICNECRRRRANTW